MMIQKVYKYVGKDNSSMSGFKNGMLLVKTHHVAYAGPWRQAFWSPVLNDYWWTSEVVPATEAETAAYYEL